MNNIRRYMMKLARERSSDGVVAEQYGLHKLAGSAFISTIYSSALPVAHLSIEKLSAEEPSISKQEFRTIKQEIKKVKPTTAAEQKLNELIGRAPTRGQYARNATIGSLAGMGAGVVGNLIEGKPTTRRGLLRSGVMGLTFGAAVPAVKRLVDIEAAKRGMF